MSVEVAADTCGLSPADAALVVDFELYVEVGGFVVIK